MKNILLIGAITLLPSVAAAKDTTVQTLTSLHDQAAILTQQLNVTKLQASIALAGGDPSTVPTPSPTGGPGLSAPPTSVPQVGNNLPTIISIVGSDSALTATVQTSTGTAIVTAPGQMLPGGLLVKSITADGVTVLNGPNVISLPFAGSAAQSATPAPSSAPAAYNATPSHLPALVPLNLPALPGASQGATAP
jgi:type IV pilus biogenesis protein PilP